MSADLASPKSILWMNDNDIDYLQAPYEAEQQLVGEDEKKASTLSGNNYMKDLVVYNYDDDPLFKQPPPRDDCGVCMLELPINGQVSWCMMSVTQVRSYYMHTSHMLISYAHNIRYNTKHVVGNHYVVDV